MPTLRINGKEITVEPGTSILQAAEQLGIEIPRFCYHDRLTVPANCRMCLVEVEGAPKPVASCAMPCSDNMAVNTESEMVRHARKGVMEMLLINHPLDCPICDQGGECDLQDQAMGYGYDRSRFQENKRAVKDKDLGPLVKTVMTRCIHCTRCVRFGEEIAGVEELGVLNRGEHLEIGTFVEQFVTSELSGNIIDICPVGALTSKPYAFTARPWELRKTESIDVLDALGSNIRVDARGGEVMRILPRLHEDVNEEWISDKTRFACDGLKKQRLDHPWVRKNGKLHPASWEEAFAVIADKVTRTEGSKIAAISGDLVDVESVACLKDLMESLKSPHMDCRQDGARIDVSTPVAWRFNTPIAHMEYADAILLIGANPRVEAPVLNARIRKNHLNSRLKVGLVGPQADLTYPYDYIGAGPESLEEILSGKHPFAKTLQKAERPMLILGMGALRREDALAVQALAREVAEKYGMIQGDWLGYNVLHTAAGRVGALELGFVPQPGGKDVEGIVDACCKGEIEVLYLLGADEIPAEVSSENTLVIYQGHHGDYAAPNADVILPGAAYTEKNAIYVNTEGRAQLGRRAVFPPGDAREDWAIIRALSDVLGHTLPYNTLAELRARMAKASPVFETLDTIVRADWAEFGKKGKLLKMPFEPAIENFYQTCPISRASETMQKCTEAFVAAKTPKKKRKAG